MAVTKLKSRYRGAEDKAGHSRDGRDLIKYCMNGHGHNGHDKRYEYVGTINLIEGVPYEQQFSRVWHYARSNHKRQMLHIIQSFSVKEFDPNDDDAGKRVNELGVVFAEKYYPNRQVLVVTQRDGKGGYWHNHILISDVDLIEHKGCNADQRNQKWIAAKSDELLQVFGTELNHGKTHGKNINPAERGIIAKGGKSWKNDLRENVTAALERSANTEEFEQNLNDAGVDLRKGKYYTYTLKDSSPYKTAKGKPLRVKLSCRGGAGSRQLGIDYTPENVEIKLDDNNNHLKQIKSTDEKNEKRQIQSTANKPAENSTVGKAADSTKHDYTGIRSAFLITGMAALSGHIPADRKSMNNYALETTTSPEYRQNQRKKVRLNEIMNSLKQEEHDRKVADHKEKTNDQLNLQPQQLFAVQQYLTDVSAEYESNDRYDGFKT